MYGDRRKLLSKALNPETRNQLCVVYFLKLPLQILEAMCNTIFKKKTKTKEKQCLLLDDATSP